MKIWNVDSGGALSLNNTLDHGGSVNVVKFSPDGKYVASGGHDNKIRIWNEDGGILHTLTGHTDWVSSLVFTPNSNTLVSGSGDG